VPDIVSILKDNAGPFGRFLKKQLDVWLSVVASPLKFMYVIEIDSKKSLWLALIFCVFVYIATIFIAAAGLVVYDQADVIDVKFLLSDFVLTYLGFCLVGLTMYGIGKALGGSGTFRQCMVAGFYLCAFWPILQAADYFLSPNLSFLNEDQLAKLRFGVFVIFLAGFAWLITVKVYPVVGYVHGFGRTRAILATLIQLITMPILLLMFLTEHFENLISSL